VHERLEVNEYLVKANMRLGLTRARNSSGWRRVATVPKNMGLEFCCVSSSPTLYVPLLVVALVWTCLTIFIYIKFNMCKSVNRIGISRGRARRTTCASQRVKKSRVNPNP